MGVTFSLEGLDELSAMLRTNRNMLEGDLHRAASSAAASGVAAGKADHGSGDDYPNRGGPYKDQTGRATASIKARSTSIGNFEIRMTVPYAGYLMGGTPPHTITPGGRWLHWERPQGNHNFAKLVNHPGTAPDVTWDRAEDAARRHLEEKVSVALDAFHARWGMG